MWLSLINFDIRIQTLDLKNLSSKKILVNSSDTIPQILLTGHMALVPEMYTVLILRGNGEALACCKVV